jgi:hypothetical protein
MFERHDTCNRCGMCCGSETSPPATRDSPWQDDWPGSLRTWRVDVIQAEVPVVALAGFPPLGGPTAFAARVEGRTYRGIWVPDHGLCADAPPWGDPASFEEMCPFLMPRQPDDSYPCALVGTAFDHVFRTLCEQYPHEVIGRRETVEEWFVNHPGCSYYYVDPDTLERIPAL